MNDYLINEGNNCIRRNDLESLKELYWTYVPPPKKEVDLTLESIQEDLDSPNLNLPLIFSKLFVNACYHNRLEIAQWLYGLYEEFDEITKIGIKSTFNYTRCITRKKNFYRLHNWLNKKTLNKAKT